MPLWLKVGIPAFGVALALLCFWLASRRRG